MKRYLLTVANRNPTFIVDDLVACGKYFGFTVEFEDEKIRPGQAPEAGFIACRLANDEDAVALAKRSISVQSLSRLIADGETFEKMVAECEGAEHDINEGSFAVKVQCHNHRISDDMRKGYIANLVEGMKLTAPVNLKNPDRLVLLSLQFEEQGPLVPTHCYTSVFMCDGNSSFPDKFNLKKRKHLNTTSMESAIALYSACQGLVGPGTIAYDPFCGSGSILVALAAMGSCVIGSDLYMPAMYRDAEHSIFENFKQYGLSGKLLGLLRCDFMQENLRINNLDAIVTDPPYGVREKCVAKGVSPLLPLLLRLYAFAATALKVGGRLVFWLPCGYNFDATKELPRHPALRLVADSMQGLGTRYCRHLITLEKHSEVQADVEFDAYDSSFLKVRELVYQKVEGYRGKSRKERKKFGKALKAKLHGLG